jgi:hypothetical protein
MDRPSQSQTKTQTKEKVKMNFVTGLIAGVITGVILYQPIATIIGWNILKSCL